jgi:hypothetical protein
MISAALRAPLARCRGALAPGARGSVPQAPRVVAGAAKRDLNALWQVCQWRPPGAAARWRHLARAAAPPPAAMRTGGRAASEKATIGAYLAPHPPRAPAPRASLCWAAAPRASPARTPLLPTPKAHIETEFTEKSADSAVATMVGVWRGRWDVLVSGRAVAGCRSRAPLRRAHDSPAPPGPGRCRLRPSTTCQRSWVRRGPQRAAAEPAAGWPSLRPPCLPRTPPRLTVPPARPPPLTLPPSPPPRRRRGPRAPARVLRAPLHPQDAPRRQHQAAAAHNCRRGARPAGRALLRGPERRAERPAAANHPPCPLPRSC